jgi:hypothetical protein
MTTPEANQSRKSAESATPIQRWTKIRLFLARTDTLRIPIVNFVPELIAWHFA